MEISKDRPIVVKRVRRKTVSTSGAKRSRLPFVQFNDGRGEKWRIYFRLPEGVTEVPKQLIVISHPREHLSRTLAPVRFAPIGAPTFCLCRSPALVVTQHNHNAIYRAFHLSFGPLKFAILSHDLLRCQKSTSRFAREAVCMLSISRAVCRGVFADVYMEYAYAGEVR